MSEVSWRSFAALVEPFLVRLTSPLEQGTELEDAGLESLTLVELVAESEDTWGIEFPPEALHWDTFATAGSLYKTVSDLARARI